MSGVAPYCCLGREKSQWGSGKTLTFSVKTSQESKKKGLKKGGGQTGPEVKSTMGPSMTTSQRESPGRIGGRSHDRGTSKGEGLQKRTERDLRGRLLLSVKGRVC